MPKPAPAAQPAPAPAPAPASEATQATKKPTLSMPKPAPAPAPAPVPVADATQATKKPSLTVVSPAAPAPADADAEAKKVQEEGLKPRESGNAGLGLKKVEQTPEEDLPDALKPGGSLGGETPKFASNQKIQLKGPADEPGGFFTTVIVVALLVLLIGVYVQFFGYAKWMPQMDAHADKLPAPPSGLLPK